MFIPYKVDVPYDRKPFVNWLIAAVMILAFAIELSVVREAERQTRNSYLDIKRWADPNAEPNYYELTDHEQTYEDQADEEPALDILGPIRPYVLDGWTIKGLFGYMWLHAGYIHLFGNLLFLWVFGNAVCAKIRNIIYLPAYLAFGLMAGICHLIFCGGSVVGASGAINGVVGMFLIFFPENEVTCLSTINVGRRIVSVSSYWIILFWFIWDVFGAVFLKGVAGGAAYAAHIGGFLSGAALAVLMLKAKWVGVERYEKSLLQLWGLDKGETQEDLATDLSLLQQEALETEPVTSEPQAPAEPSAASVDPEIFFAQKDKPTNEFIRLKCACGKKLKVPAQFAGRTGRCPQCQKRFTIPDKRPAEPEAAPQQPQKQKEPFIRFTCSCGKRVKVPADFAGKSGRCPRCQTHLKIP
jgi:membrane associated rhomboid family serine protease